MSGLRSRWPIWNFAGPTTDLRLCRFFGLSDGWWLRLQADYDTEIAKAMLAKTLAKIKPWAETAEDARAH
jgi:plasmid maintenance system antidote protein VapI